MTRRQRLVSSVRGEPVDRPAVSFYEVGGFDVRSDNPDPFNIYNDPSWKPLLDLAEAHTDLIRMRGPALRPSPGNPRDELFVTEQWTAGDTRYWRTRVRAGGRTLTSLSRRDAAVDTVWQVEHLLKDVDDLRAFLQLPEEIYAYDVPNVENLLAAERQVGEHGIVMVDTGDPLCEAASLFGMEDYLVIAMTEQALFEQLLDRLAPHYLRRTAAVAAMFPGRLWRICGPEYATEPYLPHELMRRYVQPYTGPMVRAIRQHGGFVRMHCHARVTKALPMFVEMGADAVDPLEPPPQGDADLAAVRREFGRDLTLFGNIEASDIETLDERAFERVVGRAIEAGTSGEGRGFVLMPSASPYGRTISPRTLANYRTMVRMVGAM